MLLFSLDAELNDIMLRPALYLFAIIAVCSASVLTPSGVFVRDSLTQSNCWHLDSLRHTLLYSATWCDCFIFYRLSDRSMNGQESFEALMSKGD